MNWTTLALALFTVLIAVAQYFVKRGENQQRQIAVDIDAKEQFVQIAKEAIADNSVLRALVADLRVKFTSLEERYTASETANIETQKQIETLKTDLRFKEGEILILTRRLAAANETTDALTMQLEKANNQINILTQQLDVANSTIDKLTIQLNETLEAFSALKSRMSELENDTHDKERAHESEEQA